MLGIRITHDLSYLCVYYLWWTVTLFSFRIMTVYLYEYCIINVRPKGTFHSFGAWVLRRHGELHPRRLQERWTSSTILPSTPGC